MPSADNKKLSLDTRPIADNKLYHGFHFNKSNSFKIAVADYGLNRRSVFKR
jgi:hypothetical protein